MHSSNNSYHHLNPEVPNLMKTVFPEYFSSGKIKLCQPLSPYSVLAGADGRKCFPFPLHKDGYIEFYPLRNLLPCSGRMPMANASDVPDSTGTEYVICEGGCAKITRRGMDWISTVCGWTGIPLALSIVASDRFRTKSYTVLSPSPKPHHVRSGFLRCMSVHVQRSRHNTCSRRCSGPLVR